MADASNYPTALDGELDDIVPEATQPIGLKDYLKLLGDAIARIQETLGIDPQGIEPDVAARLLALEVSGGGGGGGAGGGNGLLALVAYEPTEMGTYSFTDTNLDDFDTDNLRITFTVPDDGQVVIELEAMVDVAAGSEVSWGLMEAGDVVAGPVNVLYNANSATIQTVIRRTFVIDGLTPGATLSYDWAGARTYGAGVVNMYAGGTKGAATMRAGGATVAAAPDGGDTSTIEGGILGYAYVNPGTLAAPQATTTLSDVDDDLHVAFTSPGSGRVIVELNAYGRPEFDGIELLWGIRDADNVEVVAPAVIQLQTTNPGQRHNFRVIVEGLDPYTEYDWKWTQKTDTGTANTFFGGIVGQANMIVYDATVVVPVSPVFPSYQDEVLADSPLGFWMLNEPAGTAVDLTGNGHDGAMTNGWPVSAGPGAFPARHFDNTATVAIDPTDFRTPLFTAEAWVLTWVSEWQAVVAHPAGGAGPYGYNVYTNPSGTVRGESDTSGIVDQTGDVVVNDGEWHHLVFTYDGTDGRLYVDGVLDDQTALGGDTLYTSAGNLFIGALDGSGTQYQFEGDIAAVALYDYALSAERVLDHFNAITHTRANLLAEYTFPSGDTSGWTVSSTWSENPDDWINAHGDGSGGTFLRRTQPDGTRFIETDVFLGTLGADWVCIRFFDSAWAIYDDGAYGGLLRGTGALLIPWCGGSNASEGAGDLAGAPTTAGAAVRFGAYLDGDKVELYINGELRMTYSGCWALTGDQMAIGVYNGAEGHFEAVRVYDGNPYA